MVDLPFLVPFGGPPLIVSVVISAALLLLARRGHVLAAVDGLSESYGRAWPGGATRH